MKPDPLIIQTTQRIFSDLANPQNVLNTSRDWQIPLCKALSDAGLLTAWCSEDMGGSGASLLDGFAIQQVTGQFCTPIPLAETLLASWLLEQSGITPKKELMTVATPTKAQNLTLGKDNLLHGTLEDIPFASQVNSIVAFTTDPEPNVVVIPTAECGIVPIRNAAEEPRDRISCNSITPLNSSSNLANFKNKAGPEKLLLMGALMRSLQITGAIQTLLNMSIDYSQDRSAFGRPIGKFQVIQHNLAIMAGELSAALAATGAATNSVLGDPILGPDPYFNIASAKIRVGEAANQVAAIAHQIHGAIGFTQEHTLHSFTHRLWCWRDDFGNETEWSVKLGDQVAAAGHDALWPMITSG